MAALKREQLLLKMYDQMFNDINRHILVVWQSIGTLAGAFAILALTWKQVISLDIATSLILIICSWLLAHIWDTSYWYNRNLVIIANIERQFLKTEDLRDIHYYWGAHRPKNRMISHLKIQVAFGLGIGAIVTLHHFLTRVAPGFSEPWSNLDLRRCLPYLVILVSIGLLVAFVKNRQKSYSEFLGNSPGIDVATGDIVYGVGHGHGNEDQAIDPAADE